MNWKKQQRRNKKMKTVIKVKKWYYISWTPWTGEATYGNSFETEEERNEFISRIKARSIQTWEKEYLIEAE